MPNTQAHVISLDTVVIGGGIAGLWLSNRLKSLGYQTLLLESKALGSDQTLASQGMIHGGMKYALSGTLTGASEAIADMPAHWRQCLEGEGDVDLRGAKTLSEHFYMFSSASITSKVSTFFASKALRGRVDAIPKQEWPELFQAALASDKKFRGKLYRLVDLVLDVPSVLSALAKPLQAQSFLIDWQHSRLVRQHDGSVSLHCDLPTPIEIKAKQFIFAAGRGNSALLQAIDCNQPAMQERPLQQVLVKHDLPYHFYGHCIGAEKTPRLTISSHRCKDGKIAWYLGGSIAEQGVNQTPEELIATTQKELRRLMPWINLSEAQWRTLPVTRAEPRQQNLMRPENAFAEKASSANNVIVTWPTKLTLVPNLAQQVESLLENENIQPAGTPADIQMLQQMPTPAIAEAPWDSLFEPSV